MDVYLGLAEGGMSVGAQAEWLPHDDAHQAVAHWFGEVRKRVRRGLHRPRVRVWLSGALARPFIWGPIQGLAKWSEVELAARAAALDATGLAGPCAVSLDDWPSAKPVLVVAMDQCTVAAIVDAADAVGVGIASMRPWWAAALERQADSAGSVLAVRDSDALTVLAAPDGAWTLAHSYLPLPSTDQTQPLLDRLMLAAELESGVVRHAELARDGSNGFWMAEATEAPV